MKIFVLGATGTIGSSVVKELLRNQHQVSALARSDASQRVLQGQGVEVVRGDLCDPKLWIEEAVKVDVFIHVAATFSDDMGDVDRNFIEALISATEKKPTKLKVIYTGGCWLYGETGNTVADENTPYNPISSFSWMIENVELLQQTNNIDTVLLHPAMVYHRDGGAIARFLLSAKQFGQIEVWSDLNVRWPVVHCDDLAVTYRLAAENGKAGQVYNVSGEEGVRIGDIVDRLIKRLSLKTSPNIRPINEVVKEQGQWAIGPTLDQQMSAEKIKLELGWLPVHQNILDEIS